VKVQSPLAGSTNAIGLDTSDYSANARANVSYLDEVVAKACRAMGWGVAVRGAEQAWLKDLGQLDLVLSRRLAPGATSLLPSPCRPAELQAYLTWHHHLIILALCLFWKMSSTYQALALGRDFVYRAFFAADVMPAKVTCSGQNRSLQDG
jgi:hypothetical protein